MLLAIYVFLTIYFTVSNCLDKESSCAAWEKIQESLKLQDNRVICFKESDCSGMRCSGFTYGYNISGNIKINSCEEFPSLSFGVDIPKLNVSAVKTTIHNGDYILLKENLKIEFDLQKNNDGFTFGLFAHFVNSQNVSLLHSIPIRIPIFQHVSLPACSSSKVTVPIELHTTALPAGKSSVVKSKSMTGENCSIMNNTCKMNEMCQQSIKSSPLGHCVCISNYERVGDACVYLPSSDFTTVIPGGHTQPKHDKGSNVSLLLTAILVPITVILMIVGLGYATVRFRICQHLRRRLRVQVYEQVLLGQDEDDTEAESSNPVV